MIDDLICMELFEYDLSSFELIRFNNYKIIVSNMTFPLLSSLGQNSSSMPNLNSFNNSVVASYFNLIESL